MKNFLSIDGFLLENAFIFFQRNLNILNLLLVYSKALKGYENLDGRKMALQLLSPYLARACSLPEVSKCLLH